MQFIGAHFFAMLVSASFSIVLAQPAQLKWKLDAPARMLPGVTASDSVWVFTPMAPGWHVTTGPGVLLYDGRSANGQYSIDAQMHLFPNPPAEGFGIFVGGANMDAATNDYLLFQIRRDAQYRISHQAGATLRVLSDWRADTAILAHTGGEAVIANRIRVTVSPDSVIMYVNLKRVTALPRAGIRTDGMFGLRIGRGINMHVTNLDHIIHLAPIR